MCSASPSEIPVSIDFELLHSRPKLTSVLVIRHQRHMYRTLQTVIPLWGRSGQQLWTLLRDLRYLWDINPTSELRVGIHIKMIRP
jgi:hypothetical protein